MGSKTRLSSYCTKRGDTTVNLVTTRKTNARLARPIEQSETDRHGNHICQKEINITHIMIQTV